MTTYPRLKCTNCETYVRVTSPRYTIESHVQLECECRVWDHNETARPDEYVVEDGEDR